MAIPTKDSALVAWSINADTRLTASPATYGTTAAIATQYNTLHVAFLEAYEAVTTAAEAGTRSKPLATAKDVAKSSLLFFARSLYKTIQASNTVAASDKELLGIVVPKTEPTRIPAPDEAPGMDVVSVTGRTVKVRLHDADTPTRKGKPPGVAGATIMSYVGETPPANISDWVFEGNTTRLTIDVVFPDTVAAGSKVFLTAFWRNDRDLSGPACTPISANLQFGGVSMAA